MEETFALIRQATGVGKLEEMLLKLANQSTNHTTLEQEKRDAESKLAKAKAARQAEDARLSCMKASGVGNTELNRDVSDKLNAEIHRYHVEVRSRSPLGYAERSRPGGVEGVDEVICQGIKSPGQHHRSSPALSTQGFLLATNP